MTGIRLDLPSDSRLGPVGERLLLLVGVALGAGTLLALLSLPVAMLASAGLDVVGRDILSVPPLPDAEPVAQNSYILAADGSELAELNFQQNRVPVEFDKIPEVMRQAVIATEDAAFYEHDGVNVRAIVRAALANVRAGDITQGGSTITQQYVKNAYIGIEDAEQTLDRKITEALWAVEVEQRMTKHEILGGYLNYAYFGNGVYGVGTAARRYFSIPVGKLTLPQAAMLAGIIRAPESNDPLDPEGRQGALERRNAVLEQMAVEGYITGDQARAASQRPLGLEPSRLDGRKQQFWVAWITQLLTDRSAAEQLGTAVGALEAMGSTPDERINRVFQSGVRIHTTLRPDWQKKARAAIRERLASEDASPVELAQAPLGSIVSVEPSTGAIRTMAIGPREFGSCEETGYVGTTDDGRKLCDKTKLNPAVPGGGGSGRQPGSAYKPFVAATALEQGIPPNWTVEASSGQVIDPSVCSKGGEPWRVVNAGGGGMTDMYSGTKNSVNVFYAKLMAEVGPEAVTDMARRLGIFHSTTTDRWQSVCSMALGSQDVYPLEMASAYATFANRGTRCRPFAIRRIENRNGDLVYEHRPECERVLGRDVADRVVELMAGPVESGGTAPVANLGRWPTRGKTGTTQDNRDAWFVGYVRQLSTAAWVGYANGQQRYESLAAARRACPGQQPERPVCQQTTLMQDVTIGGQHYSQVYGSTIPAPMWHDYMSQVVEEFEPEGFPDPGPVPTTKVPDLLKASSVEQARRLIESTDLQLITRTISHYLPEGALATQQPQAGTEVPAGTAVTLGVSDGKGQPPRIPDVVGMRRDRAVRTLRQAGFAARVSTVPVSDASEAGRVLGQRPEGGTRQRPRRLDAKPTVTLLVGELREGAGRDRTGGQGPGDGQGQTEEPHPTASPEPTTLFDL